MILKHMSEKFNADTDQMKHKCLLSSMLYFSATVETAVTSEKSAGTCAGGDWSRSLRENGITALHPSETDIQTMPEILLIVLGDEGIEKT